MLRATYISHPLHFHRPAGTSRGVLIRKPCWYIVLAGGQGLTGVGEVSFIPGLSPEDGELLDQELDRICRMISSGEMDPSEPLPLLPGVRFALETAMKDLEAGGKRILYPSPFTEGRTGIPVNGLIWMGDRTFMLDQIRQKLAQGFRVLKMKVGALEFDEEVRILTSVRKQYGSGDLEIRLDANGAWERGEASEKMEQLARFGIHSIEQPIGPGMAEAMAALCREGTIPVALDEELIGIENRKMRRRLLEQVRPQYLILKPGLLGGLSEAEDWIAAARETGAGWWITSALESNIGLNAIAQWAHMVVRQSEIPDQAEKGGARDTEWPQGLGTGQLFVNNIPSPLRMEGERLWHRAEHRWDLRKILG